MRPLTAGLFTYMIIFLGLTPLPRLPLYSRGDYSYGIYLYGFPLQQTILHLFRGLSNLWLFIPLSIISATAMAIFSWPIIEKPALRIRKSLSLTMKNHAPQSAAALASDQTAIEAPNKG
jgi:peptidoglycan/LPS O-acetylase OafA/YrhL